MKASRQKASRQRPYTQPHEWTVRQTGMLGTMPDQRLADKLGLSHAQVITKRLKLGIGAFAPSGPPHKWTKRDLNLLGKVPDATLSEKLGITRKQIHRKRVELGIRSYARQAIWHRWTGTEIAMLGTMPDPQLARKLGLTQSAVSAKRTYLGIQAFHSGRRPWKRSGSWTRKEVGILGKMPDRKAAEKLNIGIATVYAKRTSLGIPAFFRRSGGKSGPAKR